MVHIFVYTGLYILVASEIKHFSNWGREEGRGRGVRERGRERELEGEKDSNNTIPGTHLNTL